MRGFYIVIDGIDGCGKGTQVKMLTEALTQKGYGARLVVTREPGGSSLGKSVRGLLNQPMDGITELLLFSADRRLHIKEVVEPALRESKIVISDRSFSTTHAIQGMARGIDYSVINQLTAVALEGVYPDLFIILDLNEEIAGERLAADTSRPDTIKRIDDEGLAFHRKVRAGFTKFAFDYMDKSLVFNGDQSIDEVHAQVLRAVMALLAGLDPTAATLFIVGESNE